LLCAGAIGYRSLRLTGLKDGQRLGLTGFGASGHLVLKMAQHRYPNTEVYVFARSEEERAFARELARFGPVIPRSVRRRSWTALSTPHRPGNPSSKPWRICNPAADW